MEAHRKESASRLSCLRRPFSIMLSSEEREIIKEYAQITGNRPGPALRHVAMAAIRQILGKLRQPGGTR